MTKIQTLQKISVFTFCAYSVLKIIMYFLYCVVPFLSTQFFKTCRQQWYHNCNQCIDFYAYKLTVLQIKQEHFTFLYHDKSITDFMNLFLLLFFQDKNQELLTEFLDFVQDFTFIFIIRNIFTNFVKRNITFMLGIIMIR